MMGFDRQAFIEARKYNPSDPKKAIRKRVNVDRNGHVQSETIKHRGDIVIRDATRESYIVP